jgi:hypothetical protein
MSEEIMTIETDETDVEINETDVEKALEKALEETVGETAPLTVEDVVESLVAELGEETSAYGVHVVINRTFEALGLDIRIPPQMMYNYSRNGMLGRKKNEDGTPNTNHKYNQEMIKAFAIKFVGKRA